MTDTMPRISIIVPVYNVAEYLPQCLDSLVNQTYPNIEIICVNDGSMDNSPEILNVFKAKYRNVAVFHQPNNGVSSARNLGLQKATGDYVMFVDSDDWIDKTTCSKMLEAAIKNHADIVMCCYVKEYEKRTIPVHIFECSFTVRDDEAKAIHRRLFGPIKQEASRPQDLDILITPCMQLFLRSTVGNSCFPDIHVYGTFEDGLFQIEVYENCRCFSYINETFYHYRKTNENSITTCYKPGLPEKFEKLYEELASRILTYSKQEEYREALNNRIVFGLFGLTLNEAASKERMLKQANKLKKIISSRIYQDAFNSLDLSYLSLPWKLFMICCKCRFMLPVVFLISSARKIRDRI